MNCLQASRVYNVGFNSVSRSFSSGYRNLIGSVTCHSRGLHCAYRHSTSPLHQLNKRLPNNCWYQQRGYSFPHRSFSAVKSMNGAGDKSVLVPIANGTEEMEAVIIIDVLRRSGAKVTVASIENELGVTCSRGVRILADVLLDDINADNFDLVALPGGAEGAENFYACEKLVSVVKRQQQSGKLHAAICASPAVVLERLGVLKDKKATSHPAFVNQLSDASNAEQRVVVDGMLTTSRGPGTAFEFALTLVKQLFGEEKMEEISKPMVMYDHTCP